MKTLLKVIPIIAVSFLFSQFANATLTTYTDRAAWQAAAGSNVTIVDLNDVTADVILDPDVGGSAFNAGPFTIVEIGTQTTDTRIDAAPFWGGSSVNGTSYLYSDLQAASNTRVTQLVYGAPIVAWGADLRANFSGISVVYNFEGAGGLTVPAGTSPHFFGIISTDEFTTLTISGAFASSARFDNISSAPVPIPAAGWLMVSALAAFFRLGRSRNKN